MISAKEALLRSQSPEVLEKIRKEKEARLQYQLKEIADQIESAIQRNTTETFYSHTVDKDLKEALESMGYTITSNSGPYYKISWSNADSNEPNDILKDMITEEPKKKKWWQKWRKQ